MLRHCLRDKSKVTIRPGWSPGQSFISGTCPGQWLKWSCEAAGGGAHLTKPQRRLEQDTGGVDRGAGGQLVGANPIPIPHPTNLALFGHKITLYSIYNTYNAQLVQAYRTN